MAAEGPYADEKAFRDAINSYNPFGDPGGNVRALSAIHQRVGMKGVLPIIIEHHQAVIAHADWIIDLGPGT